VIANVAEDLRETEHLDVVDRLTHADARERTVPERIDVADVLGAAVVIGS
jgi:hypothetical protein